jgi:hypothetical protein
VEYSNFGISNEIAKQRFEYINNLANENVEIPADIKTNVFDTVEDFELDN